MKLIRKIFVICLHCSLPTEMGLFTVMANEAAAGGKPTIHPGSHSGDIFVSVSCYTAPTHLAIICNFLATANEYPCSRFPESSLIWVVSNPFTWVMFKRLHFKVMFKRS